MKRTVTVEAGVATVTQVLCYIKDHKIEAIKTLFPYDLPIYQMEWMERNVYDFWLKLDESNRERIVILAASNNYASGDGIEVETKT